MAAILAREGAELSATETLRQALADLDLLSTVVHEYEYGLDVHRGPLAAEHAEQWIRAAFPDLGGEVDPDEVLNDDAWPALRALLYKIEDAGLDPVGLLRARAAKREFVSDRHDPARSAAKILHYRLASDLPYPPDGPDRPDLLPGWVSSPPTPAPDETDVERVELADWLRDRAHRIAGRVQGLGDHAAHPPPTWAAGLGDVPDDPIARDIWGSPRRPRCRLPRTLAHSRHRHRHAPTL